MMSRRKEGILAQSLKSFIILFYNNHRRDLQTSRRARHRLIQRGKSESNLFTAF